MAIPFSRDWKRDTLIWKENKKHEFSVKSAYEVAIRLKQGVEAEHSRAGEEGKLWKLIWELNVPPKIRNFIWRAVSNILPTWDNLYRRRVAVESTCKFCRQHPETETHLLWECPFARNVWSLAGGRVQKCINNARDFFQLFKLMQKKLTREKMEQWCTTTWTIWNARHKAYFQNVQSQSKVIYEGALELLATYQTLSATQATTWLEKILFTWCLFQEYGKGVVPVSKVLSF